MKQVIATLAVGLVCCGGGKVEADAGGSPDAQPDNQAMSDGGGGDAALCSSGLACEVCGAFTPVPMKAPMAHANVCSTTDIMAYVAACGSMATMTSCQNWPSSPACDACVYSQQTDPKWGASSCDMAGNCDTNIGGCVDVVTGDVAQEKQAGGAGSCGDLINAYFGCTSHACGNCNTTAEYDTCIMAADTHECMAYATAESDPNGACSAVLDDASTTVNSCFATNDMELQAQVTTMCGP